MRKLRLFAIASAALGLGLPSLAQSAETVNNPVLPSASPIPAAVAPAQSTPTGAAKAVLQPFGPYITQTGVGFGGANVSELYTTALYNVYGFGWQFNSNRSIADDFVIPGGSTWTVSTIKWMGYQTSAPTTGTFNNLDLNVWTNDPLGLAKGGQAHTGGNQFTSQVWSGVYRVLDTSLLSSSRAIIEVSAGGGWLPPLGSGTYWLEGMAAGTSTSGPWAPPVTVIGQTPGSAIYNGRQYNTATLVFDPCTDSGNSDTIDFLFQVEGTTGGGGASQYCTAVPSQHGCVPSFASGPSNVSLTSGGPDILQSINQPGYGNGALIWNKTQAAVGPIAYGWLCVTLPLKRAPTTIALPGGSGGTVCDGVYNWDVNKLVVEHGPSGKGNLVAGDTFYCQGWYRDKDHASGARTTAGWGPITVTP